MERGVTRRQVKTMNIRKCLPAVAGFFIAAAAFPAQHNLPTPGPSEYVDAESCVNVPLPVTEGRHIRLTLDFDPSPTNAVQVAFGIDSNHDGDLAPEETVERVGVDCGVVQSKSKVEVEQWNLSADSAGQPEQEANHQSSTSTIDFDLKQPLAASSRWNLAKVTTHNIADTNVIITANFYKTGFALILR